MCRCSNALVTHVVAAQGTRALLEQQQDPTTAQCCPFLVPDKLHPELLKSMGDGPILQSNFMWFIPEWTSSLLILFANGKGGNGVLLASMCHACWDGVERPFPTSLMHVKSIGPDSSGVHAPLWDLLKSLLICYRLWLENEVIDCLKNWSQSWRRERRGEIAGLTGRLRKHQLPPNQQSPSPSNT